MFALESERAHVQPQLARARSLQEKVTALERELLVLDRLYHRQREETHSLLAQGKREQEWTMLTSTLRKEKEGMCAYSSVCPSSKSKVSPVMCGNTSLYIVLPGQKLMYMYVAQRNVILHVLYNVHPPNNTSSVTLSFSLFHVCSCREGESQSTARDRGTEDSCGISEGRGTEGRGREGSSAADTAARAGPLPGED